LFHGLTTEALFYFVPRSHDRGFILSPFGAKTMALRWFTTCIPYYALRSKSIRKNSELLQLFGFADGLVAWILNKALFRK